MEERTPSVTTITSHKLRYEDDTGVLTEIARRLGSELNVDLVIGESGYEYNEKIYTFQDGNKDTIDFIWCALEEHRKIVLSTEPYRNSAILGLP